MQDKSRKTTNQSATDQQPLYWDPVCSWSTAPEDEEEPPSQQLLIATVWESVSHQLAAMVASPSNWSTVHWNTPKYTCWKVLVTNPVLWTGNPEYWKWNCEIRSKCETMVKMMMSDRAWLEMMMSDGAWLVLIGDDDQTWWCRRTDRWTRYFCYEVRFIYIGSLGDARQQVSSGKYRPGAGLKTIGERGDDASDDASNWENMRVM